jgi:putative transposase
MKKNEFHEGHILRMLTEQQRGKSVPQICYEYGISVSTFYQWKRYARLLQKIESQQKQIARYKNLVTAQALFISNIFSNR